MASVNVIRGKGVATACPRYSFTSAATTGSSRAWMSGSATKEASMSTWVNSGWRSARLSSSRKQRAIW
jgi:hypothetical protein